MKKRSRYSIDATSQGRTPNRMCDSGAAAARTSGVREDQVSVQGQRRGDEVVGRVHQDLDEGPDVASGQRSKRPGRLLFVMHGTITTELTL